MRGQVRDDSGAAVARGVSPRGASWLAGWGLLVAWGVCLMFSDALCGDVLSSRLCWFASLAVASATLLACAVRPGLLGPRAAQAASFWAPAAVAVGTLGFGFLPGAPVVVRVTFVSLAAVGAAVMSLLWGRGYARAGVEEIETWAIRSTVLIGVCYLLVTVLPVAAGVVLTACLPLASGALFLAGAGGGEGAASSSHAAGDTPGVAGGEGGACAPCGVEPAAPHATRSFRRAFLRTGLGVFASAMAIAILWTFERMAVADQSSLSYSVAAVCGIGIAALVVLGYALYARRLALNAFYRTICPVVVLGYFLSSLGGGPGSLGAYVCSFLAQMLLDVTLWIWLSERAAADCRLGCAPEGRDSAVGLFATGRFALEFGLLAGFAASFPIEAFFSSHPEATTSAALLAVALFVAATMFVMGDQDDLGRPVFSTPDATRAAEEPVASAPLDLEARCALVSEQFGLSARESEILGYLARGHSLPYIRNELCISKSTVDTHARHIYQKCAIHSREDLIELVDAVGRA